MKPLIVHCGFGIIATILLVIFYGRPHQLSVTTVIVGGSCYLDRNQTPAPCPVGCDTGLVEEYTFMEPPAGGEYLRSLVGTCTSPFGVCTGYNLYDYTI